MTNLNSLQDALDALEALKQSNTNFGLWLPWQTPLLGDDDPRGVWRSSKS